MARAGAGATAEPSPLASRADSARALASATLLNPAPTLLDGVLQSILTPGAGPGLVASINASILVLLGSLAWVAWTLDVTHGRRELLPLLAVGAALAVGLLASVNYFISLGGGDVRSRGRGDLIVGGEGPVDDQDEDADEGYKKRL